MLARTVRNGLVETTHNGGVVIADAAGRVLASWGDTDPVFYWRSSLKLVQATVSQEAGANLNPQHMAIAGSSHSGWPIHLAIIRQSLASVDLDEDALRCPPDWPQASRARQLLIASGHRTPKRLFHNCSGKHAAWLRACVAQGWPLDTYLADDHPLQRRVIDLTQKVSGFDPEPVGVDGCGAPVLRTTLSAAARTFAGISCDPRFAEAVSANHRYAALIGGSERSDTKLGQWWDGPMKVGAEGLLVAARHGVGIAAKSWSGDAGIAVMLLVEGARRYGLLSDAAIAAVHDIAHPTTIGGGVSQGTAEPTFED